jgi:hypothetical protein
MNEQEQDKNRHLYRKISNMFKKQLSDINGLEVLADQLPEVEGLPEE